MVPIERFYCICLVATRVCGSGTETVVWSISHHHTSQLYCNILLFPLNQTVFTIYSRIPYFLTLIYLRRGDFDSPLKSPEDPCAQPVSLCHCGWFPATVELVYIIFYMALWLPNDVTVALSQAASKTTPHRMWPAIWAMLYLDPCSSVCHEENVNCH